jgi:SET domain-containing protein
MRNGSGMRSHHNPSRPALARRRSRIAGLGVFAAERIRKHTRIIEYAGELISHAESRRREARYLPRQRIWCFTVNRRWVRDARVGGNLARFINHSCRPNCDVEIAGRTIWIRAARTINPGEELTYDYATGGEAGIPCRCRPGCRTML